MAAHIHISELVNLWTVYAVSVDFLVVFLWKYFNFIVNCTKTKHLLVII